MTRPLSPSQEVKAIRALLTGGEAPDMGAERPSLTLPGAVAVVALWLPQAATRRESWGAIDAVIAGLASARRPVPDEMGVPAREAATVLVPECDDVEGFRVSLLDAWKAGVETVALYDVAPSRDQVPASYALIRDLFDVVPLARRVLESPVLSADEVLPLLPFGALTRVHAHRIAKAKYRHVLAKRTAEAWMLPTLRRVLSASSWTLEAAAADLGISVGGLRKRLRKLAALTGIDFLPRDGLATVHFDYRLALHVYDLFAQVLAVPGDEEWAT